jgi:hypothetical protein
MTEWPFSLSAAELAAAAVVLAVLLWAAVQRANVHRWWRNLCAAVGTVAGCA